MSTATKSKPQLARREPVSQTDHLTGDIRQLIADGKTAAQIAAALAINVRAVRRAVHRHQLPAPKPGYQDGAAERSVMRAMQLERQLEAGAVRMWVGGQLVVLNEEVLEPQFWSKVDRSDSVGCWPWRAGRSVKGYGTLSVRRVTLQAHRVAMALHLGHDIPAGMQIDHLCRNRRCVNPGHLEVVTPGVNTLRGESFSALNARKTHCDSGHEFSTANTYITPQGGRDCRKCRALRDAG